MIRIPIRDTAFRHALFSNNPSPPVSFSRHIEWVHDQPNPKLFTDQAIREAPKGSTVWLIEPQPANVDLYAHVDANAERFRAIWTHDRELWARSSIANFVPVGGCWIPPKERRIWPKSRDCAIIASSKAVLPGRLLRHQAIHANPSVIAFGPLYRPLERRIAAFADFRFHLAFESCRRDWFFTEKLIDCFATGCIPIYYGCPSLGKFFNMAGVVMVESLADVQTALRYCTSDFYEERRAAIEDNFERAKAFYLTEDWIGDNAPYLFDGLHP